MSASNILCPLLMALLALHGSLGKDPPTIELTPEQLICNQPYFYNFFTKTEEHVLVDNVCLTFFPLPDDPNTFVRHLSFVFCDGSYYVTTSIITYIGKGHYREANPSGTHDYFFVGYAGCDTYVQYRRTVYGDSSPQLFAGVSPSCSPLGLSCLRKVEEVISNAGLPQQDFYILPMKLPNRCVTQRVCTLPPNPFYSSLGPSVELMF